MRRSFDPASLERQSIEYGPWNPGIRSELPSRYRALSTIFRPENVFTSVEYVDELRDFTGLGFEDLGINFRQMTQTILARHIEPHMHEIVRAYDSLKHMLSPLICAELSAALDARSTGTAFATATGTGPGGRLKSLRWLRRSNQARPAVDNDAKREERILREWRAKAQSSEDALQESAYRALLKVVSAIRVKHERIRGDAALLAPVVAGIACNEHGSEVIGGLIEPHVRSAAQACSRAI